MTVGILRVEIGTPETMIDIALQVVAIVQAAVQARSNSRIDWISLYLSEPSDSSVRIIRSCSVSMSIESDLCCIALNWTRSIHPRWGCIYMFSLKLGTITASGVSELQSITS